VVAGRFLGIGRGFEMRDRFVCLAVGSLFIVLYLSSLSFLVFLSCMGVFQSGHIFID